MKDYWKQTTDFFKKKDPTATNRPADTWEGKHALEQEQKQFEGIEMPTLTPVDYQGPDRADDVVASNLGPSAMKNIAIDPNARKAQMAQLAALQSLAQNGGRDATSTANLAEIQAKENQNERGQREAILANANARGMGGSGSSLLSQLVSSQGSVDRQSARDLGVSAQESQKALAAGEGAANIGSNVEKNDFNEKASIAAAEDAVAKFNAANTTDVSKFNTSKNQGVNNSIAEASNQNQTVNNLKIPQQGYDNQMGLAKAKAGTYADAVNYWGDLAKGDKAASGNAAGSLMGIGGSLLGAWAQNGFKTGSKADNDGVDGGDDAGGGDDGGGDYGGTDGGGGDAGAVAAAGGRVPGRARVHGDSVRNDTFDVNLSPDEVVVPRTLALSGSEDEIADFVKHPPTIERARQAQLAALKHLSRHGKVG